MDTNIVAIIPAAGIGKRFDASKRKTFVDISGVPLLVHALKRFNEAVEITEIIPVLRPQDIEKGFALVKEHKLHKIGRIAPGGRERQDSIYNALNFLDEPVMQSSRESLILIHDGVRPVIPHGTIENLLREIKDFDGVAPGIPVKETLKEVSEGSMVISTLDRAKIRAIQTPQVFPFTVIKKAYDMAYSEGFYGTDDAALVERTGGKVKIISGSPLNIKVTTPDDIEMVEYVLKKKEYKNEKSKINY
jgi:2-C-methyl-D-erythritol 4-phosphate cytidylyltransferase